MKHVVITGSTRGIGRGMAEEFLKQGFKVTLNGTSREGVEKKVRALETTFPGQVQGFAGNVAEEEDVKNLVTKAVQGFRDIHIWINNAGVPNPRKAAWEITGDAISRVIDIDLKGMIYGSVAAFRQMKKQGHGFIYNMEGFGSDGRKGSNLTLYGTTKRALRYFTRSLAMEAEETPVKVGTLSPGIVITDFIFDMLGNSREQDEKLKKTFNILGDRVETVTPVLVKRMIQNRKNGVHIPWLTGRQVFLRFLTAPFHKRDPIGEVLKTKGEEYAAEK